MKPIALPSRASAGVVVKFAAALLICAQTCAADLPQMQDEKLKLENRKLEQEIKKLRGEIAKQKEDARTLMPTWLIPVLPLLGVLITGGLGIYAALRARIGAFDAKVHDERLKAYGKLVAATDALAVHFPKKALTPEVCGKVGRSLREQYFGLAGMLMTDQSRRRYMCLAHALTRAEGAQELDVPVTYEDYRDWINESRLNQFRKTLGFTQAGDGAPTDATAEIERCDDHQFGIAPRVELRAFLKQPSPTNARALETHRVIAQKLPPIESEAKATVAAYLFRDYVVLQFASSRLRTALNNDVQSRKRL